MKNNILKYFNNNIDIVSCDPDYKDLTGKLINFEMLFGKDKININDQLILKNKNKIVNVPLFNVNKIISHDHKKIFNKIINKNKVPREIKSIIIDFIPTFSIVYDCFPKATLKKLNSQEDVICNCRYCIENVEWGEMLYS